MIKILKREITKQAIKFLIIGALSTIINYGIFFILFSVFHLNYIAASGAGYITGMFFGFFYNKRYTFRSKMQFKKTLPLYFIIYTISLIIGLSSLEFLVSDKGINVYFANFLVLIITTLTNFFGTKLLVFKNNFW